jgi:hypothetical protein
MVTRLLGFARPVLFFTGCGDLSRCASGVADTAVNPLKCRNFLARGLYFLVGIGGGLRSISVTTAIERAPFFPTARTAKK